MIFEIILIGIGLSMDAFAVSICKGLSIEKAKIKTEIIIALYFGIFQAIMPILGYYIGSTFTDFLFSLNNLIACIILIAIGANMIKDSFNENSKVLESDTNFKNMILLSIATSIDAFSVGISFSIFKTEVFSASLIIGIITFFFSFIGVIIGNKFGEKLHRESVFLGGILLIIIGFKILLFS